MAHTYSWRLRTVPLDGPETTVTLPSYGAGGILKSMPRYEREAIEWTTPNRTARQFVFGVRPMVTLSVELLDTATDDPTFVTAFNSAIDNASQLFLSGDGGTTEREVQLISNHSRDPLDGKTVGVVFSWEFRAVDLIQSIPNLGSGVW